MDASKLGIILQWDQKIVPVNQVWLLDQMLLNQEKLTLQKLVQYWDQGIPAAKSKMMLNQVSIKQQSTVKQKSQKNKDSNT